MSWTDLLTDITRILLAFVAFLALVELIRHRSKTQLDITLMLATLGVPVLISEMPDSVSRERWVLTFTTAAIIAQPYLAVRLVGHFRTVPLLFKGFAIAGMVTFWIIVVIDPAPLPTNLTLAIVAYFFVVEACAAAAFLQGMQHSGGATRWRLGSAGVGSGLLAVAILMSGIATLATSTAADTAVARALLPMLAGVGYYLAFVSPGWLSRAWQLPELQRFLHTLSGTTAAERAKLACNELCKAARRISGGQGSMVLLWDPGQEKLYVESSDFAVTDPGTIEVGEGAITRAWQGQRSRVASSPEEMGAGESLVAEQLKATALLAVPIGTPGQPRGVVAVFRSGGSLFPANDIALLELLSEQYAMALDSEELLHQQQRAMSELEATTDELRNQTVRLEAINHELETFTYSVSHDLRAPLRSINGFSEALLEDYEGKLDEKGVGHLNRVKAASRFMGQLIDDLLKLSRLTRTELRSEVVDLSAMATTISENLQKRQPDRQVEFVLADGLSIEGDPVLLQVVLENLLDNAWKFTSKHETARIEFGLTNHNGTRPFYVKDDGAGFDMEYVDKLFGAFQRLHRRNEFEGTGIGLATVQRIINRHGGRVWAESAVEQGTTFYFTLEPERSNL